LAAIIIAAIASAITISYYWRVELDKEASHLAFKIGCRRLVPAVGYGKGKSESQKNHGSKNATIIKRRQEFLYSQLEAFFRNQNCSMVYIGYFY
jgi:hypothetical protein